MSHFKRERIEIENEVGDDVVENVVQRVLQNYNEEASVESRLAEAGLGEKILSSLCVGEDQIQNFKHLVGLIGDRFEFNRGGLGCFADVRLLFLYPIFISLFPGVIFKLGIAKIILMDLFIFSKLRYPFLNYLNQKYH